MTTNSTPRPPHGPHPDYVRDARGIRYPGQLRPENLIWDLTTGQMTAYYSGEDIGAYRPTESGGWEARVGPWARWMPGAPEDIVDRWGDDGCTEREVAAEILRNFNLYLTNQPADDTGGLR